MLPDVNVTKVHGLEVENPDLVTVVYKCGHIMVQPRELTAYDGYCVCSFCHPNPVATREADCDACFFRKRYDNCTFDGKPMDSECFYGYHAQCNGCNCSCHRIIQQVGA